MAIRDNTYQKFGPLLLEGLVEELYAEINELRTAVGLPVIPMEAFLGRLNNNMAHLESYNWMKDDPND